MLYAVTHSLSSSSPLTPCPERVAQIICQSPPSLVSSLRFFFPPLYNPPLSLSLLLISSFLFCPLSTPPLALPLNFSVLLVPLIPAPQLPLFILLPLGFSLALLAAFSPLFHCIHVFFLTLVSQTFSAIFVAQNMMQSLCFRCLFVFFLAQRACNF